jgi:hypothetical protein
MEINIYLTNSFLTDFYSERMSTGDADTLFFSFSLSWSF